MKHKNTVTLPGMPGIDGANPDHEAPRLLPLVSEEHAHADLESLPAAERAAVDQSIAGLKVGHPELTDESVGAPTHTLGRVAIGATHENARPSADAAANSGPDLLNGVSFEPADTIQVAHLLNGLPDQGIEGLIGSRRLKIMREKAARRRELSIHHSMSDSDNMPLPDDEDLRGASQTIRDIRERNGRQVTPPEFNQREREIIINLALAKAAGQTQQTTR